MTPPRACREGERLTDGSKSLGMATNGATTARVAVVSVPASDQERARRFYVDQLGFDVVVDNDAVPGMD